MLRELIEKGYCQFQERIPNWEDAIRQSYLPMLENGLVEEQYVDAVIQCVHEYGPYIVLIPGVAMPHSTQGAAGCHGTGICFMHVEEPVDFDPADPDKKATLFFSLSAMDAEEHLKNIQYLMETLCNEEIVEALMDCHSIEDLKRVAERFEG